VPLLILTGTDRLYKRFGNTTSKHKIVPASFITSGERVCLCVFVLSAREHNSRTTRPIFTDRIFCCSQWPRLGLLWQRCDMLCTSGSVDDVIFLSLHTVARGDAKIACTQNDSTRGSSGVTSHRRPRQCRGPRGPKR